MDPSIAFAEMETGRIERNDYISVEMEAFKATMESFGSYATGVVAGMARAIVGHPFDTVKVKMQINPDRYKTSIQCMKMVLETDGLRGLFKGLSVPLLGNMGIVATHFSVYNLLKEELHPFIAGAIAGSCGALISSPIEFVRIKLQLANPLDNKKIYSGIMDCVKKITKERGPIALYRGLGITVAREFVGYGSFFFTYDSVKSPTGIKLADDSIRGIACGFALWGSMFPIDVVKSRIQGAKLEEAPHKAIWHAKSIYNTYGISGFFKGFTPTMFRAVPVNIAIVMAVEGTKTLLNIN